MRLQHEWEVAGILDLMPASGHLLITLKAESPVSGTFPVLVKLD